MDTATITLLERIAENAWPAETVQTVDGWRIRYTHSISRRVDSVSANRCEDSLTLEERLATVEAFYAERNAPARFHLTPITQPPTLTTELDARGYASYAETTVQTVLPAVALGNLSLHTEFDIEIGETLTSEWLAVYGESGGWPNAEVTHRQGILERSTPRQAYVLLRSNGVPCAVGRGVLEEGWLGIFCMGTLVELRGRGAGAAVLRALVDWGHTHGAESVYLQVMPDNAPAVALYNRAGLVTQYEYYYREKGTQ